MKFWPSWTKLTRLPCSLLVVSLALVAIAVPVESAEAEDNLKPALTPENFKDTVATGYWFVEHFSPWCPHCRAFAPMWAQLNEEYEGSVVNMAQVNCAVNGDLCSENKVNGYPQINLYKDGVLVETFKGSRDHDRIADFLKTHTSVTLPITPPESAAPPAPPVVEEPEIPEEPAIVYNPIGQVLKLTPETFSTLAKEGNMFVKFFAPWCGHCKKLAPIWETLAHDMRGKMTIAEVNCDDHKSLCSKQGVDGYPMLSYYAPGGQKTDFTGSRKLDSLKSWTNRVVKPTTQELEFDNLSEVMGENAVIYLFLYQPGDIRILNTVTKAARILLGSPPVFTSTSNAFLNHISIPRTSDSPYPLLVALKDGDSISPTSVLSISSKTPLAEISSWFIDNRLPIAAELGDGTFQEVMNAPSKPLVILTSVPTEGQERDDLIQKIKEIGTRWRKRDDSEKTVGERAVVFTWMDGQRWAKWLKSMYGVSEVGGVVIADHGKLLYFDTEPTGKKTSLTTESIFASLQGVMSGKTSPKNSENMIERMARYLNDKLTSVESVIKDHPKMTIFIFMVAIVGLIYGIKKAIFDDNGDQYYQHLNGKAGRLD
ncbi:thioredoxin-domain-containing protein [Stereum hirsutum FP-91666 SS1]|uniref:thioredoxin-domain-containing protein n=1 Tax=Stereum hirsutum (strain FP-91666) TaxID=721885 RepID=UPI0004449A4E|nr:thioredoxin-domain-containing protein [Stereum hirsutum FP-91666 SS1]EIM85449.1 thioredoxin-domain-containing protein [Stereum hirsutum FP-91666 SS1]